MTTPSTPAGAGLNNYVPLSMGSQTPDKYARGGASMRGYIPSMNSSYPMHHGMYMSPSGIASLNGLNPVLPELSGQHGQTPWEMQQVPINNQRVVAGPAAAVQPVRNNHNNINGSIPAQKITGFDGNRDAAGSQKAAGNGYASSQQQQQQSLQHQQKQLQQQQQHHQHLLYQMRLQKQRQQAQQKSVPPLPDLDVKGEIVVGEDSSSTAVDDDDDSSHVLLATDVYEPKCVKTLMKQKSMNIFTMGVDFAAVFGSVSPTEELGSTFAGPFVHLAKKDTELKSPLCYFIPHQPPILEMLNLFSDETLLYIFYTMPRDTLQIAAARALRSREWRYHKEEQIWYHRVKDGELPVKTSTYEKGAYIYMDVSNWEEVRKDDLILEYDKLEYD